MSWRGNAAHSVGDIAAGRDRPRSGAKVRRNSIDVDDPRCREFELPPLADEEQSALLQAAERWDLEHKEEGKYVGPLRGRGMDVLRWLCREVKRTGGRCQPSHAQIAAALKIGRRTICRIMKALFLGGFLEWRRRSIEVSEDGGVRRKQASNLYRLNLPVSLSSLVHRLVAQRTRQQVVRLRGMRVVGPTELEARPDLWERSLRGDGRLAGILALLACRIDKPA